MTLSRTPPAQAVALAQRWLSQEPRTALANFTWINNVTLGAPYCRFAHDETGHCLALHTALPFHAVSVEGGDPTVLRRLAAELLPPGQAVFSLAPERIVQSLAAAAEIVERRAEWQMLYTGPRHDLPPTQARLLTAADLPAALALAATDHVMVFGADTFDRGPFFGLFLGAELVAMGGVQNWIAEPRFLPDGGIQPGYAEIGSIITHPHHRRRGYAAQIVAALIHDLHSQHITPFLCLFQSNESARSLYEKLGFAIINALTLVEWRLT